MGLVQTYKRPLGRSRGSWKNNIRVVFKEMGVDKKNWVDSAQDRVYWKAE